MLKLFIPSILLVFSLIECSNNAYIDKQIQQLDISNFIDKDDKIINILHVVDMAKESHNSSIIGVNTAVKYLNNANNSEYKFRIKRFDISKYNDEETILAEFKKQLLTVGGVIGPETSATTLNVKKGILDNNFPFFIPVSTLKGIDASVGNVYQLLPSNDILAIYSVLINKIKKLDKKVLIWEPSNMEFTSLVSYSQSYVSSYYNFLRIFSPSTEIQKVGGDYTSISDIRRAVRKAKEMDAETIFYPFADNKNFLKFISVMKEEALNIPIIAGDMSYQVAIPNDMLVYFIGYFDKDFSSGQNTSAEAKSFQSAISKNGVKVASTAVMYYSSMVFLGRAYQKVLKNVDLDVANPAQSFFPKLNNTLAKLHVESIVGDLNFVSQEKHVGLSIFSLKGSSVKKVTEATF